MESKEIEIKVSEYLASNEIEYSVILIGETKKDNDWVCDQWKVVFKKNGKKFETMFYTGIGNRQWTPIGKYQSDSFKGSRKSMYFAELEQAHKKPSKPNSATVLHSLVMDASAIDSSFTYWCDDFGYNEDSITALNTYNDCCSIAKKMKVAFSNADMNVLKELTQDY